MNESATEIVFMPGFDGVAELREPFVKALQEQHKTRAIGYPNRKLETLNGYARHVSSQLDAASRPVLVAESFSALVAARWAANDPHVRALVLVAGFARSPTPWAAALGASMPAMAQFVGANFLNPMAFAMRDPTRQRWTQALSSAIAALDRGVVAERLRLIATEDVSRDLASLRIPVVLVQLDDDLVIGSVARDHLEAVCHNAHVIRVPGPHFAIETRPRESAEAIRAPLAALFAASRTTPAR